MYLRFLGLNGLCRPELVHAVPTIPRLRGESLPRHVGQDDIERMIATCDLTTPMGMRDRAALLLLARLALRAGDVSGLHLDDIDWDRAVIRVSGKSRREAELPLPQDVGDALRDYILKARPRSDERKVFLRIRAPHLPLKRNSISTSIVSRSINLLNSAKRGRRADRRNSHHGYEDSRTNGQPGRGPSRHVAVTAKS